MAGRSNGLQGKFIGLQSLTVLKILIDHKAGVLMTIIGHDTADQFGTGVLGQQLGSRRVIRMGMGH